MKQKNTELAAIPKWAEELTRKLLDEAPQDKAFWEIMASAIAAEREASARWAEKRGDEADIQGASWLADQIRNRE